MIETRNYSIYEDKLDILYGGEEMTAEIFERDFEIKGGKWYVDGDGWIVGENRECSAAMVMSRGEYFGDVLVEFDAATVLPATRDINVTFHGSWNEEKNARDVAYVFGLEGWWRGYVGFEKSPDYKFVANTKLLNFCPGKTYHVAVGNIANDLFIFVDGVLAMELSDTDPIDINKYGRVGLEAFCTRVKYKNLTVKRIEALYSKPGYEPEF